MREGNQNYLTVGYISGGVHDVACMMLLESRIGLS